MANLFAKICELLGGFGAATGSVACTWLLYDEPEMPKSLIK